MWAAVTPVVAQEYRGRLQGALTDEGQLAVPGVHVTLRNDATGVAVTRTTGPEGRYLFDYVDFHRGRNVEDNIDLLPGDVVIIPERTIFE